VRRVPGRTRRLSPWTAVAAALALSGPAGAVVLSGEVRGRDGAPVARPEVTAYAAGRGVGITIQGAEDGRFSFPALEGGRYELRASAGGRGAGTTTLEIGAQDLFRTTTLVLTDAEPRPPAPADLRAAVVTTWEVGDAGALLRDVAADGDVTYVVDVSHEVLYRLDVRTGERRAFVTPGGSPYATAIAPDGVLWMTQPSADGLLRFDPASETFATVPQIHGSSPQALRIGTNGVLWYTLAVSNHLGSYDPATGVQRVHRLPVRTWRQELALRAVPLARWLGSLERADPGPSADSSPLPVPSGIDITADGGIWFAQLNAHRIGRLDAETGDTRMIDTPFLTPWRLRADPQGRLWIVSAAEMSLARFDPPTGAFATWPLPLRPEVPRPSVSMDVDPRGDVWIAAIRPDALVRFAADGARFEAYRLPDHVTNARGIAIDAHGAIWTSSENPPAIVRLEP
jgi:virginiamycin B lyase